MATTVVEKAAGEASNFLRAAAVSASRQAAQVAHEARILKTVAADAVEMRVYDAAHRIRKNPFMSVAAAFAIGLPFGALVGWAFTRTSKSHA